LVILATSVGDKRSRNKPDEEYNHQLRKLNDELASLVVPGISAAEEAGKLILNLKNL
jgi:hypothetical protein